MTLFSASESEGNAGVLGGLHEQTANEAIADWLGARGEWTSAGERVGVIQGSGARPDIVLTQGGRMPVIIENEYGSPAVGDAQSRLGETLINETRPFTEIIALGLDERRRRGSRESLIDLLNANERIFSVQFVSGKSAESARVWPSAPLPATPADLVAYCEYAQAPQSEIDAKSAEVAGKVKAAGRKLHDAIRMMRDSDAIRSKLIEIVGANDLSAATQTVCAIWLIAIDLQNDLAAHSDNLRELGLKSAEDLGTLTKSKMLEAWETIKRANYLPVVEMSIPCLESIPAITSGLSDILSELARLSEELNALHAKHIYNFAGELWQQLVPDREERAAHYTKPEVAEMLATLGAVRFSDRTAPELAEIDLMDAACGTGTLVGAGERALRRLYRFNRGEAGDLHRKRMENHIIAIDVNGIAGTLTAKRLTDMDVERTYEGSKMAVTSHEAGSLSLLDPDDTAISQILGYRDVTQQADERGNVGLFHIGVGKNGVDWALMNPPYSRPRRGRSQPTKGLAKLREKAKRKGYTMSNGQAGLATDFGNLSMMRTKKSGVLSHVLPMTAAYAGTWTAWREGIESRYENIVAITNTGEHRLTSMSADTGMSEMLVVATRKTPADNPAQNPPSWDKPSVLCVNLRTAPAALSEGYALAKEIADIDPDAIMGSSENLNFVRMQTLSPGFPWYCIGNASNEVSSVVCALLRGEIYNPLTFQRRKMALDMATMRATAGAGPTHDLLGHPAGRGTDTRGAFRWTPVESFGGGVSAHMSMWAANGKAQTRMIVEPTHAGELFDRAKAENVNGKQSRWFINKGVSWTSQSLLVAKTNRERHGGRAWNALQGLTDATGACVALFFNSVFGAFAMRAYGQSPQQGPRGNVQVGAIPGLPCPNFAADSDEARKAREIAMARFDELSRLELEPFPYCFRDKARHMIDNAAAEMLGLDPADSGVQAMLAHYRCLFASEPNINGGQKKILAALAAFNG